MNLSYSFGVFICEYGAVVYANGQDLPDGATVWNKVAKLGMNRHIQYTL